MVPLQFTGFSLGRATWDGMRSQTDSISFLLCLRLYDLVRRLRQRYIIYRPKCSSAAAVPTCSARRHTHLLLTGRLNRRRAQFAPFVGTMPSHHYLLWFTVLSSLSPVLLALCCLLGRVSSFWGFLAQNQAPLLHSSS